MRIAVVILIVFQLAIAKHHRHRAPVIDLNGADELVATIREGEIILNTVPDIVLLPESGPVCKYVLTSSEGTSPFDIEVVDKYSGSAVIRLKDGMTLDCKKSEYNMSLQAVRCDDETIRSESIPLHVNIKDTNNHVPEFDSPWYTYTIDEGKLVQEIATLKAVDADCGDPFGEVCEYKITNGFKNFPFAINNQGVLRNTQPLNFTQVKSYILTIVAIDCGMRSSKTVLVTVNVVEACTVGIKNMPDRVHFVDGAGPAALMSDIKMEICPKDTSCEVESLDATVELHAGHVTPGCSRDDLYSNETIQSCGLNTAALQLLDSQHDRVNDLDQSEGYKFNEDSTAIVVPQTTINELVSDVFSLSFSMKHDKGTKEEQNNKQSILCESDDFNMNRHHFSIYLRHCKLEVLLRRENGAKAEFRAAEWRWAIPQVCDNQWHDYSLLFNGVDDVTLIIDGEVLKVDERNPEILDDWPLHKALMDKTKLTIGACWHGRQKKMVQHFRGELQSIYLLNGAVETQEAISCAHKCPEQLSYGVLGNLADGQAASLSADHSVITVHTTTIAQMTDLLNKIKYANTMSKALPGHRSYTVRSSATCKGGKKMDLPITKGYIFVEKAVLPILSISGTALLTSDHHQVKMGSPMIPDIKITVSHTDSEGKLVDVTETSKLDYCRVYLKPSRDMDVEYFSSPASLITNLHIDFEHDKEGILLKGEESVHGYLDVLSKVHYFNTRPETYHKRIYSVQCAMQKGAVMSNEFIVTMTIEQPTLPTTEVLSTDNSNDMANLLSNSAEDTLDSLDMIERRFEPAFDQLGSSRLQNILEMDLPRPKALMSHHGYEVGQGAVAGGAVAVVVVVCVGFLLVLLVLGVLKMRDTPVPRKRKGKRTILPDDGLHWDDSGMNITVNPLDDIEKQRCGGDDDEEEYSEEDVSSDGESECSFREEEVSDEEECSEVLPHLDGPRTGLEWDDEAALTPNARSYRV
ncbi:unnamed protein product [Auanema sp. JU1783]|nr:unnamed protein product [Auanema sp. JU1783]